jgi:hypothetical protein
MRDAAVSRSAMERLYTQFAPNRSGYGQWSHPIFEARWHDQDLPRDKPHLPGVVEAFLASPEWASLPWQRDEVSRG